jgi:hypothetical protein
MGLWPVNENEEKQKKSNEYFARIHQGVFSIEKQNKNYRLKLKKL